MAGLIDSYRGMVHARECDYLGHMNLQFYIERVSQAYVAVVNAIGLTPSYNRENRLGLVAVNLEANYLAEMMAGDVVHVKSGLLQIENKKLMFHHRLYNSDTGILSMTANVLCVCMSLDARKSMPLPEFAKENAKSLLVKLEDLS